MTTTSGRGWTAALLNLLGGAAVAYALIRTDGGHRPLWAMVLGFVAVGAWVLRGLRLPAFPGPRTELLLATVAAFSGGFSAAATQGFSLIPGAVGIAVVLGTLTFPLRPGLTLAAISCGLVPAGAVTAQAGGAEVLTMTGGMVLATAAGYSRRQFRQAENQTALLRERELLMRQEAERVAIARDLHDVLAHSLGGLVLQLDAVEALLEAGEREAAAGRVTAARSLAAEGLREARRAVSALRAPRESSDDQTPPPLKTAFTGLLEAHRSLGGVADFEEQGPARQLSGAQTEAFQRALQEGLSNARRHAPGEPVRVGLDWHHDRVRLTVSNPLADEPATTTTPGGGLGLTGMRERFGALPGGRVSSELRGDRFVLTAEAAL